MVLGFRVPFRVLRFGVLGLRVWGIWSVPIMVSKAT